MNLVDHKEKLLELYNKAEQFKPINVEFDDEIKKNVEIIAENVQAQTAVYTVLITLSIHKILNKEQDIRYHQKKQKKGFAGRTIDRKYITPTLAELGFPYMESGSGWLTRSLEDGGPFTQKEFKGRFKKENVQNAFLFLVDKIQKQKKTKCIENIIIYLLYLLIIEKKNNDIKIVKLKNPDRMHVSDVIKMLKEHFFHKYNIHNGSKLPVIAIYAIYHSLLTDIKRYENCNLKPLGSHTASDRNSKRSGDIEIYSNQRTLQETIEIKFEQKIDLKMVKTARKKIIEHNPVRYYILSTKDVKSEDKETVNEIIKEIKTKHGCQLILGEIIPSIEHYLRLISSLGTFINTYSKLIEKDKELKTAHKEKWKKIIEQYNKTNPIYS